MVRRSLGSGIHQHGAGRSETAPEGAQLPFPHIFGGSSNVIAIPKDISDNEKQLVWEFIQSLTTPEAQTEYNLMYCTPTARTDVEVPEDEVVAACPVIGSWVEALNSPNLVDYFPNGAGHQDLPAYRSHQ